MLQYNLTENQLYPSFKTISGRNHYGFCHWHRDNFYSSKGCFRPAGSGLGQGARCPPRSPDAARAGGRRASLPAAPAARQPCCLRCCRWIAAAPQSCSLRYSVWSKIRCGMEESWDELSWPGLSGAQIRLPQRCSLVLKCVTVYRAQLSCFIAGLLVSWLPGQHLLVVLLQRGEFLLSLWFK